MKINKVEFSLSRQVYEKEFHVKALGYECYEVDNFIDRLNLDIRELEIQIENLKKENERLTSESVIVSRKNSELEIENAKLKASKGTMSINSQNSYGDIELIKRISGIENTLQRIEEKINKQ